MRPVGVLPRYAWTNCLHQPPLPKVIVCNVFQKETILPERDYVNLHRPPRITTLDREVHFNIKHGSKVMSKYLFSVVNNVSGARDGKFVEP